MSNQELFKDICIKGKIPGEKSKKLGLLREKVVAKAAYNITPIFIDCAKGAMIKDIDGNCFLDFTSGISVMNIGHSHPSIIKAVKNQAEKYFHTTFHVVMYEPYIKLAEKLSKLAPGSSKKKVMFLNSGAEAVENAIKIARAYTKKPGIIVFDNAFHGRTLFTLALTSKSKKLKEQFGPYPGDIYRFPYAYCYRCSFNMKYPQCDFYCTKFIENALETWLNPEDIGCILIEPIQGEGGFIIPPDDYLVKINEICKKYNMLLIVDEVQTGFGRSGKLFDSEHSNIEPDIMTLAKSIGAGIPLAAVISKEEIIDSVKVGGLGSTFGGNPLACVAGLEVLDIIEKEKLLERSNEIGRKIMDAFTEMQKEFSTIGDIRGKGSMVAFELVKDRNTKEPAAEEVAEIMKISLTKGLLLLNAGVHGNIIRILVPLVVTDAQLKHGLEIIRESLREITCKE